MLDLIEAEKRLELAEKIAYSAGTSPTELAALNYFRDLIAENRDLRDAVRLLIAFSSDVSYTDVPDSRIEQTLEMVQTIKAKEPAK